MSDSEVIRILEEFSKYLSTANIFIDPFRWLMWIFVQGLAFIIDGMENLTNQVLLVKNFFETPAILNFLQTFRPVTIILLAFSILFTGYLLIFKRKAVQGEAIAINLTITLAIFSILTPGIHKINETTDEAINALNVANLYNNETGTISENIVIRNTTDLLALDRDGWSTKEVVNNVPPSLVLKLKATERFDPGELKLENSKVAENFLGWDGQGRILVEFDQGGFADWNNEYYYRYNFNWFTIIVSLLVMGFTLFTITLKLAKLSYEIAFNQILAMIIAPTDIHDGAKTKKILQNILNMFIVIIFIFLSMRLYIIGLEYLTNNFEGIAYLILLIGFSMALIDGPNIVERLYGIDAGIKSGWGALAGGLALAKVGSSIATGGYKGASNVMKNLGNQLSSGKNDGNNNKSPLRKEKENVKSPFKQSNNEKANDQSSPLGNQATSGQNEQSSVGSSEEQVAASLHDTNTTSGQNNDTASQTEKGIQKSNSSGTAGNGTTSGQKDSSTSNKTTSTPKPIQANKQSSPVNSSGVTNNIATSGQKDSSTSKSPTNTPQPTQASEQPSPVNSSGVTDYIATSGQKDSATKAPTNTPKPTQANEQQSPVNYSGATDNEATSGQSPQSVPTSQVSAPAPQSAPVSQANA
ncbi:hypothetical protein C7B90_10865, partial [Lysinibacillus fusiformis]